MTAEMLLEVLSCLSSQPKLSQLLLDVGILGVFFIVLKVSTLLNSFLYRSNYDFFVMKQIFKSPLLTVQIELSSGHL